MLLVITKSSLTTSKQCAHQMEKLKSNPGRGLLVFQTKIALKLKNLKTFNHCAHIQSLSMEKISIQKITKILNNTIVLGIDNIWSMRHNHSI